MVYLIVFSSFVYIFNCVLTFFNLINKDTLFTFAFYLYCTFAAVVLYISPLQQLWLF